MESCNCGTTKIGEAPITDCCQSQPGPTFMSSNVAHIDPLMYNRNFYRKPNGGNYIKIPKANRLGISSPFSNQIRSESGFCCTRLSNDCSCNPITYYKPGENLPGVYKGYESSCPCYPIDLPNPNKGLLNQIPWTIPYVDSNTKKVIYVTNPDLVNIETP